MVSTESNSNFCLDQIQTDQAWVTLQNAKNIAIISHRHPDPDTIGSNLALREFLINQGKQVQSFCVDKLPLNCLFLPSCENYQQNLQLEQFDLLISVDCGSSSQTAYAAIYPNLFQRLFINIDHHSSNNYFGSINIVNTALSSTCEIVYNLFQHWQIAISPTMATYLLFGLYYDTGSFMHSNTTPAVLQMAEQLLKYGANQKAIIKHLYKNFTLSKFHLWGDTLNKLKVTDTHSIVGIVTAEEIAKTNSTQEELSGVIDYLSMAKQGNFAVLINQDNQGQIKGSLRTRKNDINLSALAEKLGGGGHRKASGFSFPGQLVKQVNWQVISNNS